MTALPPVPPPGRLSAALSPALRLDLLATNRLPPLPRAYLAGQDLDLLAPLQFLAEPAALPALTRHPNPAAARRRADLARALAASNHSFGHPAADEVCRRLADPATRVVVTGQQPGLLGGPLMTFAKLVAAARYAAALEALGEPAVAVFWVATEDHDYSEVSQAAVPAADRLRVFGLGPDPEPLLPVGMRTMPQAIKAVLRGITEAVPDERYAAWIATLASWYGPFACVGTAFCRSISAMLRPLGTRAPLLLDAMHPALKAAERPFLTRLVERRAAVEAALARQDETIAARRYALQVAPQRGASPLFLLRGAARRRIAWLADGDTFTLRGLPARPGAAAVPHGSVADLLRTIDENPSVVSPGVLARPAVADAVLGTTLQVLGPGELSYMAQAAAVYPVLEIEAPHVTLRPQTLVLDERQVADLAALDLPLAAVLGDPLDLDRALVTRAGADFVAPVAAAVAAAVAGLAAPSLAVDPALARPLGAATRRIEHALTRFANRAVTAIARHDEPQSRRVATLRQACMPGGKPQERAVSAAHFHGVYGDRLAASYWQQLDLEPRLLSVIVPAGADPDAGGEAGARTGTEP